MIRTPCCFLLLCTALLYFPAQAQTPHDGSRDFDFEIGSWKMHLKRLQHPLSGSTTWVEYKGTTVVKKVWNGKAIPMMAARLER